MAPIVSIIVANYNGGRFVRAALASATRQTLRDIEIIFVDDASTDNSLSIASGIAARDPRIHIISLTKNSGPSAARNAGLATARGRWLAILDSDDMMHPDRLNVLIEEMKRSQANICADNVVVFQQGAWAEALLSRRTVTPKWITASEYVLSNQLFASTAALGYLKPIFDAKFLHSSSISYDPRLRIGEDYDFVLRQLLSGAKYRLVGSLGYFYRKHEQSISHRISAAEIDALLDIDGEIRQTFDVSDRLLSRAFDTRRRSLERARAFTNLVTFLKSWDWAGAAKLAVKNPGAVTLLKAPIMARIARYLTPRRGVTRSTFEKQACLISRQRIIGNTNGSSSYLLSLCGALRSRGYRITLVSPSPATFGRWPFLYFHPEMRVFDEVFIRGSWRIGRRLFLAKDPRVFLAATLAVLGKLPQKLGFQRQRWSKPAPYAIGVPWSAKDKIFIAQHAPRESKLVIADYAFLTPGIPYALAPDAHSLVVMHDLFCSRTHQFESTKTTDSVATLDETSELALLNQADSVVAIQAKEASFVAQRLPEHHVILAPMAVSTITQPQPGDDRTLLFVGSNTAPNVIGLNWFLNNAWPMVLRDLPDARLLVAGSIYQNMSAANGVRFLGLVQDIAPLYRDAGVVISPLTVGSGLKIKLIEALGQGKAVIATSVTVEGVEELVKSTVTVTDDPSEFAHAVVRLLTNAQLRNQRCQAATTVAKRSFSPAVCYADFLKFVDAPVS